jgi:glycosyltransferase involved in cell wall biosynthesis
MKLSACVITKNEEKTLPMCLQSVQSIVDEIIVVDTGSKDNTVEVAKSFGAQVYHFEWVNDFSKAKNYALSKATGDWIIFLDADEYFTSESIPLIKEVIKDAEAKDCDLIISLMCNFDKTSKQMINSVYHVRIFRRHPEIQYVGAIHERVVRNGVTPRALNAIEYIKIIHTGYSVETVKEKNKSARNLDLLKEELKRNPNSGDIHFYLAESYMTDAEFEIALSHAKEAHQLNNFSLMGLNEKNYINMITCMIQLKYTREELIGIIKEAIEKHPTYPDFYFYLGDCYAQDNRLYDALQAYSSGMNFIQNAFVSLSNAPHQAPAILDRMGTLHYKLHNLQESVKKYVEAVKIDRYYYPALCNLLTLFLKYEKMENVIEFLAKVYDYGKDKDLAYLIRASLQNKVPVLAEVFFEATSEQAKKVLDEELALIHFQKGNYTKSADLFLDLYRNTKDEKHGIHLLAATFLTGNRISLLHLKGVLEETLLPLWRVLTGESPELELLPKDHALQLFILLYSVQEFAELQYFLPVLEKNRLLTDLADSLFVQERYAEAEFLYQKMLTKTKQATTEREVDLQLRLAECQMKLGRLETAASVLQRVKSASPDNYLVYDMLIKVYNQLGDFVGYLNTINDGLVNFSDSAYLIRLKNESTVRE